MNDIDIDIDAAIGSMKDVMIDQVNDTPELQDMIERDEPTESIDAAEKETMDHDIMNPFGLKFGEQPEVKSADILFRSFEADYKTELFIAKNQAKPCSSTSVPHNELTMKQFDLIPDKEYIIETQEEEKANL